MDNPLRLPFLCSGDPGRAFPSGPHFLIPPPFVWMPVAVPACENQGSTHVVLHLTWIWEDRHYFEVILGCGGEGRTRSSPDLNSEGSNRVLSSGLVIRQKEWAPGLLDYHMSECFVMELSSRLKKVPNQLRVLFVQHHEYRWLAFRTLPKLEQSCMGTPPSPTGGCKSQIAPAGEPSIAWHRMPCRNAGFSSPLCVAPLPPPRPYFLHFPAHPVRALKSWRLKPLLHKN